MYFFVLGDLILSPPPHTHTHTHYSWLRRCFVANDKGWTRLNANPKGERSVAALVDSSQLGVSVAVNGMRTAVRPALLLF